MQQQEHSTEKHLEVPRTTFRPVNAFFMRIFKIGLLIRCNESNMIIHVEKRQEENCGRGWFWSGLSDKSLLITYYCVWWEQDNLSRSPAWSVWVYTCSPVITFILPRHTFTYGLARPCADKACAQALLLLEARQPERQSRSQHLQHAQNVSTSNSPPLSCSQVQTMG